MESEKMNYSVDKIDEKIALLENIETKEKIELALSSLPSGLREGMILSFINDTYVINNKVEIERRTMLRGKFNRLKNNNWK